MYIKLYFQFLKVIEFKYLFFEYEKVVKNVFQQFVEVLIYFRLESIL